MEKQYNDKILQRTLQNSQTDNGCIEWRINGVSKHLEETMPNKLISPPFYTKHKGYKMCLTARLNGDGAGKWNYLSIHFAVMRGEYDPKLDWPFMAKVTITLISQDHRKSKDIVRSFIPDSNSSSVQLPTSSIMNESTGFKRFALRSILNSQRATFVKDDAIYIKAAVDTSMLEGH